jgi:uncharacterized protein
MEKYKKKIWVDMDNSPHVPFFKPIIEELVKRGYCVMLTARDCYQVCKLADLYKMDYQRVGIHYGKNKLIKGLGLLYRAAQLASPVIKGKPDLALSHGSRSQMILSSLLRIPTVMMTDYEHARGFPFFYPDWLILPEMLPESLLDFSPEKIRRYSGIKEDVYVPNFKPQTGILQQLGIDPENVVVTIRPPATQAHYFKAESLHLFDAVMDWLCSEKRVSMILLPRNESQAVYIRDRWPEQVVAGKIVIPAQVVEGLNLIWYSDLVISGGGTMNREAAALEVPVYSIFRGDLGSIDKHLSDCGRLTLVKDIEEMRSKIVVQKRNRTEGIEKKDRPALRQIVDNVQAIIEGI